MADDPPVQKPPFDPSELLNKLDSIVKNNKAPSGGGNSWVGTIIIIAVVLMGIAVWSWVSYRNNRELAKLRHEKETQRILAEKAAAAAVVAKNDATIAEAKQKVEAINEHLKSVDADIRAEEERYAANLRAIDRIRSWRDVDPSAGG